MKKIRQFSTRPVVLMSVLLCFCLASCKKEISFNKTSESTEDHFAKSVSNSVNPFSITGEEWFRSIFYADGKATANISCLSRYSPRNRNLSSQEITELRLFESQIISDINAADSSFFQRFHRSMEYGNLYEIKWALDSAATTLAQTVNTILIAQNTSIEDEYANVLNDPKFEDLDLQEIDMAAGVALIIVVVILLALVVNVNVVYHINISPDEEPSALVGDNNLTTDVIALEIFELMNN